MLDLDLVLAGLDHTMAMRRVEEPVEAVELVDDDLDRVGVEEGQQDRFGRDGVEVSSGEEDRGRPRLIAQPSEQRLLGRSVDRRAGPVVERDAACGGECDRRHGRMDEFGRDGAIVQRDGVVSQARHDDAADDEVMKRRTIIIGLLPIGMAAMVAIDRVLGDRAEYFHAGRLLTAWEHTIRGRELDGAPFLVGQEQLGDPLALTVGSGLFVLEPLVVLTALVMVGDAVARGLRSGTVAR